MTALAAPAAEKPALAHDAVITTAGFRRSGVQRAKCVHNCHSACNFNPLNWGIGVQN
jgi:hypothetical protein